MARSQPYLGSNSGGTRGTACAPPLRRGTTALLLLLLAVFVGLGLTLPASDSAGGGDAAAKAHGLATTIAAHALTITLAVWATDRFSSAETPFAVGSIGVGVGVLALGAACSTSLRTAAADGLPQRVAAMTGQVTEAMRLLVTVGVLRVITLPPADEPCAGH